MNVSVMVNTLLSESLLTCPCMVSKALTWVGISPFCFLRRRFEGRVICARVEHERAARLPEADNIVSFQ